VRWRPDSPSIYLPNSGQIDLNAIGVEAGQANNSQTALNDAAVRDMIGKASGAQNAMDEYYGASSNDGVESEDFGNGYAIGLLGYVNQGTSGALDGELFEWGSNLQTGADTYAHRWPCSFDGKPHAFTAAHPSAAWNSGDPLDKNPRMYSNNLMVFQKGNANNNVSKYRRSGNANILVTSYSPHRNAFHVSPLQRLKPGTYTITGETYDNTTGAYQAGSEVWGNILQFETMTPVGDAMAAAGGRTIKNQLAYSKGAKKSVPFTATVNIQYEWVFMQMGVDSEGKDTGQSVSYRFYITSISRES
jgi:hypothetical protein